MPGIQLTWIDFIIVGIVLFSTLISVIRGFVREALSLASWILAVWVAINFSKDLSGLLVNMIHGDQIRMALSFFILFAITIILGAIINFLIGRMVKHSGLSGTDRLLGMIFGIIRGVLVVSLALLLGSLSNMPEAPWWQHSAMIPIFKPIALWIKDFFPENLVFHL